MGTALDPVTGSGSSCPTWSCRVSNLCPSLLFGPFGMLLLLMVFTWILSESQYPSTIFKSYYSRRKWINYDDKNILKKKIF